MGACDFETVGYGKTASEAFRNAVEDAQYQHGHGGYSGTIAEKHSFKEVSVPADKDYNDVVNELMDDDDSFVQDKWGDAGCVKIEDGKYKFFGWASS